MNKPRSRLARQGTMKGRIRFCPCLVLEALGRDLMLCSKLCNGFSLCSFSSLIVGLPQFGERRQKVVVIYHILITVFKKSQPQSSAAKNHSSGHNPNDGSIVCGHSLKSKVKYLCRRIT